MGPVVSGGDKDGRDDMGGKGQCALNTCTVTTCPCQGHAMIYMCLKFPSDNEELITKLDSSRSGKDSWQEAPDDFTATSRKVKSVTGRMGDMGLEWDSLCRDVRGSRIDRSKRLPRQPDVKLEHKEVWERLGHTQISRLSLSLSISLSLSLSL